MLNLSEAHFLADCILIFYNWKFSMDIYYLDMLPDNPFKDLISPIFTSVISILCVYL